MMSLFNHAEFKGKIKVIKQTYHVMLFSLVLTKKSILASTSTPYQLINITETSLSMVERAQGDSSLQKSSWPLL